MKLDTTVSGRFSVEDVAGRGGMATVYRGIDLQDGSVVALKEISLTEGDAVQRFLREAELLHRLKHPAIVQYRARGLTPEGRWFIAMEWVEGQDLAARLRSGPLSVAQSLSLAERVADALATVHKAGAVHRDLKPSNLLLPDGDPTSVKLADFGVAHFSKAQYPGAALTATGAVVGTPGYLAPEQILGTPVDERTDLFALGCVLFECLTGQPAFQATSNLALMARIACAPSLALEELRIDAPPALTQLVSTLMQKDAALRPASARETAERLRALIDIASHTTLYATAPSSSALTSNERRLVTVLAGCDQADPFESLGLSQATTEALAVLLAEHGCPLHELPGGARITVLSSEGETESPASERAARLALELPALFPEFGWGIVTGRAELDGCAPAGPVIDQALALARQSDPRTIAVDDTSARFLVNRFEVSLTGRGSLRILRAELGAAESITPPAQSFIGRRRELDLLTATYRQCEEEECSSAVLLTGDAGLGKSRLLQEFIENLKSEDEPRPLLIARGEPMQVGSSFALLRPALRRLWQLSCDRTRTAEQHECLTHQLSAVLDAATCRRLRPFLAELAGLAPIEPLDNAYATARQQPSLMNEQLRRAFGTWLSAVCQQGTQLIVLDDLHWGDMATLQLLDDATRYLESQSLMIVALAQPSVSERMPQLSRLCNFTELKLSKLSPKASERLVHGLSPGLPLEQTKRIVQHAAGNPFFLQELVRAASKGAQDRLPDTVLGTVEARLAELPPRARWVLRGGSVFGEVFWQSALENLLTPSVTRGEVHDWLRMLEFEELISANVTSKLAVHRAHAFRHSLLGEASYATLTPEDRVRAHGLAARWLQDAGELDAAVLAKHFRQGVVLGEAARMYCKAAEQALQGNDLPGTLTYCQNGLDCAQKSTIPADELSALLGNLYLHESEARTWQGQSEPAQLASLQALGHLPSGSEHWCTAVANLGDASLGLGNWDKATTWVERLQALQPTSHEVGLSRAAALAGQAMLRKQRSRASLHYERAAELFSQIGAERLASGVRCNAGLMYLELGAHEQAARVLSQALDGARDARSRYAESLAATNLGLAWLALGRQTDAIAMAEQALRNLEEQQDIRLEVCARAGLAEMLCLSGRLEEAEVHVRRALATATAHAPAQAAACAVLAVILVHQGRTSAALVETELAMNLLAQAPMEEREMQLRRCHVQLLRDCGRLEEARAAVLESMQIISQQLAEIEWEQYRESYLAIEDHQALTSLYTDLMGERWQSAPA